MGNDSIVNKLIDISGNSVATAEHFSIVQGMCGKVLPIKPPSFELEISLEVCPLAYMRASTTPSSFLVFTRLEKMRTSLEKLGATSMSSFSILKDEDGYQRQDSIRCCAPNIHLLEYWCIAPEANVTSLDFKLSKFAVTSNRLLRVFDDLIFASRGVGALSASIFFFS